MRKGRFTLDDVAPLVDERTRVVTLSYVQYFNGFKCDLAGVADICHRRGALLVIDGTQAIGAMTLDSEDMGVDVLVVSAHKWLLGPLGIGFLALSGRAMARIGVSCLGWLSVNDLCAFRNEIDLRPDARRFEPGTNNGAGIYGLHAALDQIARVGSKAIEHRVLTITERLCEGLRSRGYEILSPRGEDEASGIVIFRDDKSPSEAVYRRLTDAGICVSLRGGGVRVSPHYYNSEDEIDQLLRRLD